MFNRNHFLLKLTLTTEERRQSPRQLYIHRYFPLPNGDLDTDEQGFINVKHPCIKSYIKDNLKFEQRDGWIVVRTQVVFNIKTILQDLKNEK